MNLKNELPEGWTQAIFGDVCSIRNGYAFKSKDFSSSGIPLVKQSNLTGGDINLYNCAFLPSQYLEEYKNFQVRRGDILIGMSGSLGEPSIYKYDYPALQNQRTGLLQASAGAKTGFVRFFMEFSQRQLEARSKGMAIQNVSAKDIEAIRINVPPLNEQRRIVEKIEMLFARLDRGEEAIRQTQKLLARYRQSVLKAAVTGELTADWRAERQGQLEHGRDLLANIQHERISIYEQMLSSWKKHLNEAASSDGENGKTPKPKSPKTSAALYDFDIKTPEEWLWVPLGGLALEVVLGKMLDKQKNRGIPRTYLGNINVRWGTFEVTYNKKMLIKNHEVERYGIIAGDLIVCEGGEPGRCAVWKGEENTVFIQKALHRVRFTKSYNSSFAHYFMKFASLSGILDRYFTGTTIKHLTGAGFNKVPFPVCTLAEQEEIIRRVEKKLAASDRLEHWCETELKRSAALRQSILKQAFAGKLVDQDPDDEPASVLLARIAKEKAATAPKKKTTRRRKAAS